MKTHLAATFGVALSVALGAAMGCGTDVDPQGTAVQSDVLAPSAGVLSTVGVPRYFTVNREEPRRCEPARCDGWLVEEANAPGRPVYVARLDLSRAGLSPDGERELLGAPVQDILLRGSLELDLNGARVLVVTEALQGMPGFTRASDDGFYGVSCLASSCQEAMAYRVDTASHAEIDAIAVDRVLAPFVSQAWLLNRVEYHGAIVAGHLVPGGYDVTGTAGKELEASQVFVRLPATSGPCPLILHFCPSGSKATYTRDANLCLDFAGCAHPGICPLYVPACAEGYTLTSWAAGDHACPAFACDPDFVAN